VDEVELAVFKTTDNRRSGAAWLSMRGWHVDLVWVIGLSLVAQMTCFSAAQGRAVISADSIQYVAAAEALLHGDSVPHFEMRKPGFIFWLWLIGVIAGNMGWAVIAANHALLATLPVAAYGFGTLLHSRLLGWCAALVTMAKLQTAVWGNRMMSEALYATLLSFGLLAACAAMKRRSVTSHSDEDSVDSRTAEPPLPHGRGADRNPERKRVGLGLYRSSNTGPRTDARARRSRPVAGASGSDWRGAENNVLWLAAGVLLGLAWLTRGTASAVIAAVATVLVILAVYESIRCGMGWAKHALRITNFLAPVALMLLCECTLNFMTAGHFATSTGTKGAALLLRMTFHQGENLPESSDAAQATAWIPERSRADAFVASDIDVWVARHRALHDHGLTEWEYDQLMGGIGRDLVARHFGAYAASASAMALHHLLRRGDGRVLSLVSAEIRLPALRDAHDANPMWWALPELATSQRQALTSRMQIAATAKAPFGDGRMWSGARYALTLSPLRELASVLQSVGGALVVVGLLAGLWSGRRRSAYVLLFAAMIAEATLVGLLLITTDRFQFVWIAADSALASAALLIPIGALAHALHRRLATRTGRQESWRIAT